MPKDKTYKTRAQAKAPKSSKWDVVRRAVKAMRERVENMRKRGTLSSTKKELARDAKAYADHRALEKRSRWLLDHV